MTEWKARDVLADDVEVGRPAVPIFRLWISRCREIVRQRIEPDVGGLRLAVAGLAREGNSPRETGAAGRDVVESLIEQRQHLVAAALRPEKIGFADELAQPVRIRRQPEEPVLLFDPLQRARRMQNAFAVDDLVVLLERLAADAVPARVRLLVEIVRRVLEDRFDQRPHTSLVIVRGRSDELVVRDGQLPPHFLKSRRDLVHQRLRLDATCGRFGGDLLAVLVHPDQKMDVVAEEAVIARYGVGADLFECVAEMGVAIGIVNGGRDVELSRHQRSLESLPRPLLPPRRPRRRRLAASLVSAAGAEHPRASSLPFSGDSGDAGRSANPAVSGLIDHYRLTRRKQSRDLR